MRKKPTEPYFILCTIRDVLTTGQDEVQPHLWKGKCLNVIGSGFFSVWFVKHIYLWDVNTLFYLPPECTCSVLSSARCTRSCFLILIWAVMAQEVERSSTNCELLLSYVTVHLGKTATCGRLLPVGQTSCMAAPPSVYEWVNDKQCLEKHYITADHLSFNFSKAVEHSS